ncbi:MAG: hypothetical protein HY452_01340 [Parcubacteria group bacterium]|nr:hypothetical protein [Parcubacteria group bacterium]
MPTKIAVRSKDFVVVPRKEYERLLDFEQAFKNEIHDTDAAVKIYLKEKKQHKLKNVRSLADLG